MRTFSRPTRIASTIEPGLDAQIFADIAGRLRLAHARREPVGASPRFIERLAAGPQFGDHMTLATAAYQPSIRRFDKDAMVMQGLDSYDGLAVRMEQGNLTLRPTEPAERAPTL